MEQRILIYVSESGPLLQIVAIRNAVSYKHSSAPFPLGVLLLHTLFVKPISLQLLCRLGPRSSGARIDSCSCRWLRLPSLPRFAGVRLSRALALGVVRGDRHGWSFRQAVMMFSSVLRYQDKGRKGLCAYFKLSELVYDVANVVATAVENCQANCVSGDERLVILTITLNHQVAFCRDYEPLLGYMSGSEDRRTWQE